MVDVVGRIVVAKMFRDGTENRVNNQVGRKNLAVEFFAAEQPREKNVCLLYTSDATDE